MAHSTDSDSDFVSTTVPSKKVQTNATVKKTGKEIYIDIDSASQDMVKKDDESDEEIYVKKKIGDRKYVEGVTKIKEAKRKRNSGDNRATIKKQKTVKEQKIVKDILKELPSINTRSTPGLMKDVVSSLTSEQKDWVKRMRFKAFLKINIKHYDEGTNSILIKGKRIKITKEKIHKVFGLPKTGKSLFDLGKVSEDHQVFDGWMKELEDGKANATNYKKIIQKSEQVDMNFKLGFIALFVNTFAESIPMGTNNLVPVRALVEVDDISKIDWCAHLLYCVKNSKGRWRPDNPKCYYIGPMLLLLTADKLKERQSFEIEAGGLGVGNLIEQSSNLELDKNENQVNENQDTRIEEYEEKYEKNFSNVSTEKNDMEDIIFHCLSKFPEDNRTKEMIRKFREIFSTTHFSSREKSEIVKERTEVKVDRDEELNKTNIFDSDDDKDERMNTKLVAFLAVKPLQQKFPENEETQEEDQDMNVDD
ncbi:unnamed protein product [Lactuca saligna]|uniref:Uncharacterized protein n=1 Tax=Lactuca saligna TaxID=75948 RepID=A0AA35YK39_LACSI|nr:unnamed protein product [Lactuca saligna]